MTNQSIYSVSGCVVHGRGRGKAAGLPTVNLPVVQDALPPLGVYASKVYWKGQTYVGVTNLGYRPTVDSEPQITCETFILHLHADLYGQPIRVELLHFLRPTRKMRSLEEVRAQVAVDAAEAEQIIAHWPS